MRIKKIKIPIYRGKIILIQAKDWREINKKFGVELTNEMSACFWSHTTKKGYRRYLIAFIGKKTTTETVVHETVHLVNQLFSDVGIQKDRDNDEPEAYLLGYLAGKIKAFLS